MAFPPTPRYFLSSALRRLGKERRGNRSPDLRIGVRILEGNRGGVSLTSGNRGKKRARRDKDPIPFF